MRAAEEVELVPRVPRVRVSVSVRVSVRVRVGVSVRAAEEIELVARVLRLVGTADVLARAVAHSGVREAV